MSDFGTVKRNKWKVNKARKAMNVGTVKPRTIKIEDSNIANLGSELEKKVRFLFCFLFLFILFSFVCVCVSLCVCVGSKEKNRKKMGETFGDSSYM